VVTVITFNQLRFGTLTLKVASGGKLVEVDGVAVTH